jgi:hypothetical protein
MRPSEMGGIRRCAQASPPAKLLVMTAWITLFALTVLIALALQRTRPDQPPLAAGYDGERQLTELRALITTPTTD